MAFLKETVPGGKVFTTDCDVYLESSHICIRKNIADKIFGSESSALTVFYAKDNTFMAAPAGEDLFKTIHKGAQQLLKTKNAAGDRSISVQELILDHEIDGRDRNLDFVIEEALHILKVKL